VSFFEVRNGWQVMRGGYRDFRTSDSALAPPLSQDPNLFLVRGNEFGLFGLSSRKFGREWRMMLVSPSRHLANEFFVSQIQSFQLSFPAQDFGMV